ncbi:MAG: DUF4340 domain-containing protein [Bacteroidota bacterium]
MFKRFTNQQLLIALGVILGLYVIALLMDGKKERTFKATLSSLDTAAVSRILIEAPNAEPVELQKQGPAWQVKLPDGSFVSTGEGVVQTALESISRLEAKQLISRLEADWSEYEVDSAATRVQVFAGAEPVLNILLGKFAFQGNGGMTHARLEGEAETYLVDGYLAPSFRKVANDWRNNTLIQGNQNDWNLLTFSYLADSSFQLFKGTDNLWRLADSTEVDNSAVATYLNQISRLDGGEFIARRPTNPTPDFQLAMQDVNGTLVEVKAFADLETQFLLTSNLNPEAVFNGASEGLWQKVFVGMTTFLPANP